MHVLVDPPFTLQQDGAIGTCASFYSGILPTFPQLTVLCLLRQKEGLADISEVSQA